MGKPKTTIEIMERKNNFAFPLVVPDGDKNQNGMTIREYFAAHAPKSPKWFKPKMPEKPIHPGYLSHKFGKGSGHKGEELYVKHYFDEDNLWLIIKNDHSIEIDEKDYSVIPKWLKTQVEKHRKLNQKYWESMNKWNDQERMQRIVQWRYFYADQMVTGHSKVLTISQPYAHLIAAGIKKIENRTWQTKYRGKILIHASAKWHTRGRNITDLFTHEQWIDLVNKNEELAYAMKHTITRKELNYSAIIGEVTIKDCIQGSNDIWAEKGDGIWHWVLEDAVIYEKPITGIKGKLQLWNFEPEIKLSNDISIKPKSQ